MNSFQKDYTDLYKPDSAFPDWNAEFHTISLIRRLLEYCGGKIDKRQHKFDANSISNDNLNIYCSLVGLAGSNDFGNFDSQSMLEQLAKSRIFTSEDLQTLNVREWADQISDELDLGFPPGYLV